MHAAATAEVVPHGQRFPVAFYPVEHGTDLVELGKRLRRTASRAGISPTWLLLDCGLYRVASSRYLQAARYPFILPVLCRGRRAADPRGPSGTRGCATPNRRGGFRYTLTTAATRTATGRICIHCRNWRGRRNRHGRHPLVYACWGLSPTTPPWV